MCLRLFACVCVRVCVCVRQLHKYVWVHICLYINEYLCLRIQLRTLYHKLILIEYEYIPLFQYSQQSKQFIPRKQQQYMILVPYNGNIVSMHSPSPILTPVTGPVWITRITWSQAYASNFLFGFYQLWLENVSQRRNKYAVEVIRAHKFLDGIKLLLLLLLSLSFSSSSLVTGLTSWYFSWTSGDPHRSGFKFHTAVLSVLYVMNQV
jgi:hypothetical protein